MRLLTSSDPHERLAFIGVTHAVNFLTPSFLRTTSAHNKGRETPYHIRHIRKIDVNGGEARVSVFEDRLVEVLSSSLLMKLPRMSSSISVGRVLIVTAISTWF
jgi:hypothetical protein